MSRKSVNADEFDLSLTGSQISAATTSRKPNSGRGVASSTAKRPSSAGSREKNESSGNAQHNSKGRARSQNGSTLHSGRNNPPNHSHTQHSKNAKHKASAPQSSPRDDFMSFFETGVQPKILKPQQQSKKSRSKPAWLQSHMNSARSDEGVENHYHHDDLLPRTTSHVSQGRSHAFHSVFQPTSARSISTVDSFHTSGRETSRDHSREDCHVGDTNSHGDDVNFNFESNISTKEDLNPNMNDFLSQAALGLNSNDGKSQKLNSLANNMTSQAMSPGTKTSLLDLENAFQNLKHKMPVNQVRHSPQNIGRNLSEDGRNVLDGAAAGGTHHDDAGKHVTDSAVKIQRWFRRHMSRKKAGQAAVQRMLDAKKAEVAGDLSRSLDYAQIAERGVQERRQRIREEKQRQARQQAIQEMQRRREEKRQENQAKAEQEERYLQASGKISGKVGSSKSNVKKSKASGTSSSSRKQPNEAGGGATADVKSESDEAAGPARRGVDDFFQQNNNSATSPRSTGDAAAGETGDATAEALRHHMRNLHSGAESARDASHVATRTTLDDLMETLKKLEEDEKLPGEMDKNQTPQNWLDDLEREPSTDPVDLLTADKLEQLNRRKDNRNQQGGLLTDEKLRSILSFLDEVETAERVSEIDQELSKQNEAAVLLAPLVPSGEEIAQLEQASAMASEVTNTVLSQRLELEEKKRSVSMLQKALNQQRELTVRHARETDKEMKKRLDVQKDEYEETIKRHLGFIDQLIDDKKTLSERCETLVSELKQVDRKYSDKIKALTETHDVELRKVKEVQAAAEKLRRERWIDEKTKKIKEMTVKGLEPEIQRLIAKHKAEMKRVKAAHEAELTEADQRAGQRYVAMTEQLRDQLAQEKEAACARERDLARKTYEKQLQQEEEAYQAQRRRLYAEVQEEKERVASSAARQRAELDKLQRQLEDNHSTTSDVMRAEYEKAREEQERRHATELRQLKEQLVLEKEAWEENYRKKQETHLMQKERELKESVRKERDREIELVIGRLEEDSQATRDECERVAENRIKRIRDKYESEMAELERSERLVTEKYNQTKAQLAEFEGECERMKVTLKQKDKETEELKKLLERLNEERSRVSDVIRQEFADRLVAVEEESRRVKAEMAELKARQRVELERARAEVDTVQKAKQDEMEEVHKRVKAAISKKEEVVTSLKQQYAAAVKRADHLEGLLEQQRKQLLTAAAAGKSAATGKTGGAGKK